MGWPKYLRKTYSKEELNKKVLKKVQLAHDKEFLASLFVSEKRGEWCLKKDLSKEESKRLKKIVKEIKAGRGGVKTLPLIVLFVLAGGVIVFTLLFKNPLGEKLMEKSLESVFGAQVDVDNLKISLINTGLEWERLAVTDETNPGRNLIETGLTRIRLNGRALLMKKYVIESWECRDMGWDTKRETPGRLIPGKGSREGDSQDRKVLPFLEEQGGETVRDITRAVQDPEAFVQDQWDSLKTPPAARAAAEKYEKLIPEKEGKIEEIQLSGRQLSTEGEAFLNRDFTRYKDNPAEIPQLVKEADDYRAKADSAASMIQSELKGIEELRKSLEADKREILMLKDEDYRRLGSLIALPRGGVEGLFKGIIQSYAASLLGDRYARAMSIKEYILKYRQLAGNKEKDPKKSRGPRRGRIVSFDSPRWPAFLLREGYFSARGGDLSWTLEALDITTEPDSWDKPVGLSLNLEKGEGILTGEGTADLRSGKDTVSRGQIDFAGLPVSSDALSSLGISRFSGSAGGKSTVRADHNSWLVETNLILSDTKLVKEGEDRIADLIYSVLSREDWNMGIILEGEGDRFSLGLDWPLLSRIDGQIETLLREQSDEFLKQAEEELTRRFAGELGILDQYTGDLDGYSKILKGDLSSLNQQKEEIDKKIEEIKTQAASRASDKTNEVLESTGAKDALNSVGDSLKKLF